MTLTTMRDILKANLQLHGNPNFPDALLTHYLNIAQRDIQTQLNGLGMKKWEASDALTLTETTFNGKDVKTASLSTDCPNMLESPKSIIYIDCDYLYT